MLILISFFSSSIPIFLYLIALWYLDKNERESFVLVVIHFLWGAIGAIFLALIGSMLVSIPIHILSMPNQIAGFFQTVVISPAVEEFAKGIFLFIILYTKEYDNLTDGMVYGGAIGLGFGMTENFLYFTTFANTLNQLIVLVYLRTLFTVFVHLISTSTFGSFLAIAKFSNSNKKLLILFVGYLSAVAIHMFWNLSVTLNFGMGISVMYMLIVFAIFIFTFLKSIKKEKIIINDELTDEVLLNNLSHNQIKYLFENKKRSTKKIRKYAVKLAFTKNNFKNAKISTKSKYEKDIFLYRYKIKNYFEELNIS